MEPKSVVLTAKGVVLAAKNAFLATKDAVLAVEEVLWPTGCREGQRPSRPRECSGRPVALKAEGLRGPGGPVSLVAK